MTWPWVVLAETLAYVRWRWAAERRPECLAFDALHGTDTANWTLDYEPTAVSLIHEVLDAWDGDPTTTTFCDLGCGKGRALLVAARKPFVRVVGIEHIRKLAQIATTNARVDSGPGRLAPIEVFRANAAKFKFPDGPLLVYLYNPFGADVLEAALEGIRDRAVDVIYLCPQQETTVLKAGFVEVRRKGAATVEEDWRLYRREGTAAETAT